MKIFKYLFLAIISIGNFVPAFAMKNIKLVELTGADRNIEFSEENPTVLLNYTIEADRIPKKLLAVIEEEGGVPVKLNFAKKNRKVGFASIPDAGFIPFVDGEFGSQEFLIFVDEDR